MKGWAIMGHTHMFSFWRITVLHCLCLIFIVVYGGMVILIWVTLSWWEAEVVPDQILLALELFLYMRLWALCETESIPRAVCKLFIFVYPAEHCTQPDYVSWLIWWYPIGKYFERVIEMNEINHHRNFRDHLKGLKIHHTYWFSVTHQSLYSATNHEDTWVSNHPSAPSW